MRVEIRREGSGTRHLEYAMEMCDNRWNHLALVRDEEKIYLFINGSEEDSHSFAFFPMQSTGTLRLGYSPIHTEETEFFGGYIHSVHISEGVLYPHDFTPKQPVPSAGTLLLWSLSEGMGVQVYAEETNIEGTIDGASWIEACPYGL